MKWFRESLDSKVAHMLTANENTGSDSTVQFVGSVLFLSFLASGVPLLVAVLGVVYSLPD